MSIKDTALAMIKEAGARHIAQELANSASLSDDHPTWAIIAMVGSVLGQANADQQALVAEIRRLDTTVRQLEMLVGNVSVGGFGGGTGAIAASIGDLTHELADMKRKVTSSMDDNALLSQKMPGFLSRLEDVLVGMRKDISQLSLRLADDI